VRLLSTAGLDCSRSGSFKMVLGARFRFDLGVRAMATASSFKPWQQRQLLLCLLTICPCSSNYSPWQSRLLPDSWSLGPIAIWPVVNAEKQTNDMVRRNSKIAQPFPI
jgi:hypothetical protein